MKVFFGVLLAISVIVNIYLAFSKTQAAKSGGKPQMSSENVQKQIREIAVKCGTSEEQAKKKNSAELLADVKHFLDSAEMCDAVSLPNSKLGFIKDALGVNNNNLFIIIKEQDQYISKLSGKKFIILPSQTK